MKVAIVHDSLLEFGGAERTLAVFFQLFPQADLYTMYFEQSVLDQLRREYGLNFKPHADILQSSFFRGRSSLAQLLSPFVWRYQKLDDYDLVLSHSFHLMANLVQPKHATHIQYIQSPPKNIVGLEPISRLQYFFPYHLLHQKLYLSALRSTPYIIVNSQHILKTIREISGIVASVIYPPVQIPLFYQQKRKPQHYLFVSRLEPQKGVEIVIEAANRLHLPLKILGESRIARYKNFLHHLAGPTISFEGIKTLEQIRDYYQSAYALIFASRNEDFGISPVEAMASGIPVIAFHSGGVTETVVEYKTGMFFYEYSADSLVRSLRKFDWERYSPKLLHSHAKQFSVQRFKKEFEDYLSSSLER